MIYFILGAAAFLLVSFVLFAILNCSTTYDRMVDDEEQEEFLRNYKKH